MFQDVSREHLQGKDAEATISFAGVFDSADVQSKETGAGPLGNTTLSGPIIIIYERPKTTRLEMNNVWDVPLTSHHSVSLLAILPHFTQIPL